MKKLVLIIVILLLVVSGVIFGWIKLNHKEQDVVKRTRFLMDTYCTIQVPGEPADVDKAIDLAFTRMEEIDQKFNSLNPKSPLYQFNNSNVSITDPEIINIIKIAQKVSEESDGAFDITLEPLVQLWGFYADCTPHVPSKQDIQKCLTNIGYKQIIIKDGAVIKAQAGVRIDLGAIAKGYAIIETIKVLKNQGIQSALIEAGGQVYAFGNINGKPWKIGIRNPRGSGVIAGLQTDRDMTIATSGDYERFFEQDGVRYHHILDPKTGYPAQGVISMSVIMQDPILADAWSTALFVMGPEKAMKLAEEKPELGIIMVNAQGKIQCSSELTNKIDVLHNNK